MIPEFEKLNEEEIELMLKPTNSRTGRKSILIRNISFGNGQCLSIGNLRANTEFEASAWYYDENSANSTTNPTKPGLSLKGTGCTESLTEAAGVGSKKWSRIKVAFTCANAAVNAKVCLYSSKGASNSSTIHFDELRVAPKAAFTTTFAYDAKGRMISSADPNEVATHYEYDAFGNLSGIRNDDGVLLSEQAKKFGAN